MILWTLLRTIYRPESTLGVLSTELEPICLTCEDPFRFNLSGRSAIPAGSYFVKWFDSPKHGKVFLLEDVPSRDMVEIHIGNGPTDTEGCILVGNQYGYFPNKGGWGVGNSTSVMEALRIRMTNIDRWMLQVIDSI